MSFAFSSSTFFAILLSLFFSGVVVVLAASWIVAVNVATVCSMCSGVFNGMLQIILLSIAFVGFELIGVIPCIFFLQ